MNITYEELLEVLLSLSDEELKKRAIVKYKNPGPSTKEYNLITWFKRIEKIELPGESEDYDSLVIVLEGSTTKIKASKE